MGRRNAFKLDVVSVRLVKDVSVFSEQEIHSPQDAVNIVGKLLCDMDREMVCVVNLRTNGVPINCTFASIGAINYATAEPRELLKSSILSNAANIMLIHNHPSSNLTPSKADVGMTDRMQRICELVGIPLIDHVIVGGDNQTYFSFKEKGIIKNPCMVFQSNYEYLEWEVPEVAEKGKGGR